MKPLAALAVLLLLAGCSQYPQSTPLPQSSEGAGGFGPVTPVGMPTDVATGLAAPWSMVRLDDGSTLVSQRDAGTIVEVLASGEQREVGSIDGAAAAGEGGLLGLAVHDDWLYAYLTTASDNRIVRVELLGDAGDHRLGDEEEVLTGLDRAGNHNGGRIAFGPDGMLYATVGDAGDPQRAQNEKSLNGKILRMTPTGGVPNDNPFGDSLVYSMGHRNPQGITWDDSGQLWAAEFGQDTWDEFNRIKAGGNYGWPVVEGEAGNADYIDPVLQWGTDDSSPSGLVYTRGTFFMAGLGGERLWVISVDGQTAGSSAWFEGDYGRIRDVAAGPDGTLWMLTNNTDGRGDPRDGDDRIIEVPLGVLQEG